MGQSAEELTTTPADIEATRTNLTRDIDELTDKVSPSRALDRRKETAKGRFRSIRDKVMGSATDAGGSLRGTASSASESISGTATGAVSGLESRAQGNPLAAGVVAFGAGMLLSALIPQSDKETQAAQRLTQVAKEQGQPLIDEARSVGQDMAADLKESAAESAQQVQATAQDSVENIKQEGQSSAQTVKDEASPR
jgi:gas vesicle protein